MVLKLKFKGFMAPVFTPFDSKNEVNLKVIPKYAEYLSSANIKGLLVNGSVGEGVSMTTDERKRVTEAWVNATKVTGQAIMVHVGGTNLKNVAELAKHAESLKVSSILCLADLFFRPATVSELIEYLKEVYAAAPNTPLCYYHYPAVTGIDLNMKQLLVEAFDKIPTFAGIKYTHNDMSQGAQLLTIHSEVYTIFLGNDMILSGAINLGFDSFILTYLNFAPEELFKIKDLIQNGKNEEALKVQRRVLDLADLIMSHCSWTAGFKTFISLITGIELGSVRLPLKPGNIAKLSEIKAKWESSR